VSAFTRFFSRTGAAGVLSAIELPRTPGVYRGFVCLLVLLLFCPALTGYSVLTHEAIIDSAWDDQIKPILLLRFPAATPSELKDAHAYAYGGCILQDMGYYPFGSRFFSDLLHYVRSGDFILNLIRESQDLNEYAFALGALSHYAADTNGHSIAVNRAVPLEYPGLARKYGGVVTYEDNPTAHLKVEFGFDVVQVSRGHYAPQAYHDFIGFQVAKPVLERAFRDTYSLDLADIFADLDLALATYRHSVSTIIPAMTRVAWALNQHDPARVQSGITRRQFVYNLSRASYRKEWDHRYREPGIGTRIIAFLLRILPKIGPLKALSFRPPTPRTNQMFEASFNHTMDAYRGLLKDQNPAGLSLPNLDFDTGQPTRPGEYRMADDAYAQLVIKLSERDPSSIDPKLRENILAFYRDLAQPFATRKNAKQWRRTLAAIEKLKMQPAAATN